MDKALAQVSQRNSQARKKMCDRDCQSWTNAGKEGKPGAEYHSKRFYLYDERIIRLTDEQAIISSDECERAGSRKGSIRKAWLDGEPIRVMVTPRQREPLMSDIEKIYGSGEPLETT